jgi:hypothetical protein
MVNKTLRCLRENFLLCGSGKLRGRNCFVTMWLWLDLRPRMESIFNAARVQIQPERTGEV